MRRRSIVLLVVTSFGFIAERLHAENILGTVRSVSGIMASLTVEGELLPNMGDPVIIFFKLAGSDEEISVATASVAGIDGETIQVSIKDASGTVEKGQLARITSAKPHKKLPGTVAAAPLAPAGTGSPPELQTLLESGGAHYDREEYQAAVRDFKAVLEKDPNNSDALYNLGLCYREMREWKKALANAERALALGLTSARFYELRGEARMRLHKSKEALADFNRAIASGEATDKAYMFRAWLRVESDRWSPEILADCNKALELGSDQFAYYTRAMYYNHVGNWEGAVADWEKASALSPEVAKQARPYLERARARLKGGKPKR